MCPVEHQEEAIRVCRVYVTPPAEKNVKKQKHLVGFPPPATKQVYRASKTKEPWLDLGPSQKCDMFAWLVHKGGPKKKNKKEFTTNGGPKKTKETKGEG